MTVNFDRDFRKQFDSLLLKSQNQVYARLAIFKGDYGHRLLRRHKLKGKYLG